MFLALLSALLVPLTAAFSPAIPKPFATRSTRNVESSGSSLHLDKKGATDFMFSFYDKLQDIFSYNQGSSNGLLDKQTSFFLLIPNGIGIDLEWFKNNPPTSPTLPQGDLRTTEAFAGYASDQFTISGGKTSGNLDNLYGTIVNGAESEQDPNSDKAKKAEAILAKVNGYLKQTVEETDPFTGETKTVSLDSPDYTAYKKATKEYNDALINYQVTKNNFDLNDPVQQRQWVTAEIALSAAIKQAQDDIAGYPNVIKALQYQTSYGNDAVAYSIKTSKDAYKASQVSSLLTPGTTYHVSYGSPSNFYDTPSSQRIEMKSSDSKSTHTSEAKQYGGGTSFNYGLFKGGASVEGSDAKERFTTNAQNEELSFDLSTVLLNRPWMDTTLFKLDGWSLGGQDKYSISDGKGVDVLSKDMPYMSTALIIANNVEIKGDWTAEDREKISNSLSTEASVSYGPFSLKGKYAEQNDKEYNAEFSSDNSIKVPGAQIIGMIMAKTPASAPLSGK